MKHIICGERLAALQVLFLRQDQSANKGVKKTGENMVWQGSARRFLAVALFVVLAATIVMAQSDRGTLAGTILDNSGAVVANATITITGVDTGTTYTAISSSAGAYRVPDMRLGRYNVSVAATGFKKADRTNVLIQVNTVSALDITLDVGNTTETVTVSADAPTLQTESSDIGTVVTTKQIQDLPLALFSTGQSFLRSPETFVFLT
ncbi:MAG TPA: carboxypeptidase-like regulatory domain-containing protein, partial [Terriglobales bacterium]|nr:carboxypeptidase-like regulatory domain-containing protein [Terriglobales bacterium]